MDTPSGRSIIIKWKVLMSCLPARSKTKEADLENILEEINEALASSVNQSKAGNGRWRAGQMRRGPAARRPFINAHRASGEQTLRG